MRSLLAIIFASALLGGAALWAAYPGDTRRAAQEGAAQEGTAQASVGPHTLARLSGAPDLVRLGALLPRRATGDTSVFFTPTRIGESSPPDTASPDTAVPDTTGAVLDTALAYAGTTEIGDNRGPDVKRFLRHVGLGVGNPYCAAFVSWCLDAPPSEERPRRPTVRTGLAKHFVSESDLSVSRKALRRAARVPTGWIVTWQKGNGPYGHDGMVRWWRGRCGRTVEANTSQGAYGNQRDGEGIWRRERCFTGGYFHIRGATPVLYDDEAYEDEAPTPLSSARLPGVGALLLQRGPKTGCFMSLPKAVQLCDEWHRYYVADPGRLPLDRGRRRLLRCA